MLAIKLSPRGKKHHRTFRLVVQERRSKLNGKFMDDLGWYDPHTDKFEVNKERATHWLSVGAKPTITVANVLQKSDIELPKGTQTSKTYTIKPKAEEKPEEEKTDEKAENSTEEKTEEAPAEETTEETKEETKPEEAPAEETPTPEAPAEDKAE